MRAPPLRLQIGRLRADPRSMGSWLLERILFIVAALIVYAVAGSMKEDWAFVLSRRRAFAAAEARGEITPFRERAVFRVFLRGFYVRCALWAFVALWFLLRIAPVLAPFTRPLFGGSQSGCSP